ncbi:MAG: glycosyltransferase family 39 protein [Opitutaceae bacterium]|nr:glycosyltransferase family 39 protein [Opitutaceae bacterium]
MAAGETPPPDGPAPRRRPRLALVGALALTLLHFLWLTSHLEPAIMSPDANGYVVQARLLADEGRTSFATASPVQYVGMHWLETETGTFHSRYPAGLPLIMAGAWKIGGLNATLLINPLFASATVLLVFFLARRVVEEPYALVAALVVAVLPTSNQHALDADAHIAATFFLVGGVLALLRFAATGGRGAALLAGILLGVIPSIRYPEAIVGVTIGAWLLWRIRPVWRVWPAVLGAALPLGALLAHNAAAYGAFWRTGYALTNEQTGFGLGYFAAHALPYLQALSGQGLTLMFAFGVAGLAAMGTDPRRRAEGVLFAGITVPVVLLYMAYYFGGGGPGAAGGNLRFLVPTFPFFAVAGIWLLARVADHLGRAGTAAVAAVIAVQALMGIGASAQVLTRAKASLGAAARARAVAEREIPAGSVVIVDRQLAESLDATGRWRLVEETMIAAGFGGPGPGFGPPGGPAGRGGLAGRGPGLRPPNGAGARGGDVADDAPNPQQRGKNRAQQERYAGLRPEERRARVWADLATWADGKPVFWFARSLDAVETALPGGADYRSVAEVEAPTMFGPLGGGPAGISGPGRGPMPGGPGGPGFAGGGSGGRRGGNATQPAARLRVVRVELAPQPKL